LEKLYSNTIGVPVFEDDNPRPFTSIKDIVVDPENGKVLGFVVDVNRNKILTPFDIISWKNVVKVNRAMDVTSGEDILRVDEVQKNGVYYVGNRVETKKGEYLGKVYDLAIDSGRMDLRKIFVAKSILGMIRYENRIISAKDIVEVLPEKIVVKEGARTVKERVKREVAVEDMAVG